MRLVATKSPTAFNAWAVRKGLKPAVKQTRQEHAGVCLRGRSRRRVLELADVEFGAD